MQGFGSKRNAPMILKELEDMRKEIEKYTVRARALGGYSVEAESLLIIWENLLKITRHLEEQVARKK